MISKQQKIDSFKDRYLIVRSIKPIILFYYMISSKIFGITKCKSFDIDRSSITGIIDSKYVPSQGISYLMYNHDNGDSQLIFETDPIKFTQYGIPLLNNLYYKTDKDRNFFKIPYDPEQKGCIDLFKMLKNIDNLIIKNKKNMFDKLADKYSYKPLVKEQGDNDDNINDYDSYEKKKGWPIFDHCKVKFYNDHQTKELSTAIFERQDNGLSQLLHNIKSVTDATKYLRWCCTARFIIIANKIWINKVININSGKKEYGVSLKCLQIEVVSQDDRFFPIKKFIESNYMFNPIKKDSHKKNNKKTVKRVLITNLN